VRFWGLFGVFYGFYVELGGFIVGFRGGFVVGGCFMCFWRVLCCFIGGLFYDGVGSDNVFCIRSLLWVGVNVGFYFNFVTAF